MLDSSHVIFVLEGNSYHYANVWSYWLDWLVLRDILNTVCNVTSAEYKEVVDERGGEGGGGGLVG